MSAPTDHIHAGSEDEARAGFVQALVEDGSLIEVREAPEPEPDPIRAARIAACPEPFWHETHRYCPSCPWTEADG